MAGKGIRSKSDKVFDGIVSVLLALTAVIVLFPLFFVASASLTPYEEVIRNGGFLVIPKKVTLEAYQHLLENSTLMHSFGNTAFITVVGTLLNMLFTILAAWPLSRKKLPGRHVLTVAVTFTLMFNGGIIPTYLVVQQMGLVNTLWSLIIPQLIWTSNLIILKNFMEALPEELVESAKIDGASDFRILVQIVIPLCVPILMTVAIYYGVAHWNEFQQAILYVTKQQIMPMQVIVRDILNASQQATDVDQVLPTMTLQMAAVVTASLPMIIAYPFIQKVFVAGTMSGAIKG